MSVDFRTKFYQLGSVRRVASTDDKYQLSLIDPRDCIVL